MNTTYSIQIKHHRTGVWTHVCTHTTSADKATVESQFEKDYNQPVRAVVSSAQAIGDEMDRVANSIVHKF